MCVCVQRVTSPQTLPMSRSDIAVHLQCVSLGEGRGDRDTPPSTASSSNPRRPHPRTANATALSDVDEQSVGGGGSDFPTDRALRFEKDVSDNEEDEDDDEDDDEAERRSNPDPHRAQRDRWDAGAGLDAASEGGEASGRFSERNSAEGNAPGGKAGFPRGGSSGRAPDPVLKSLKEPRYQGFSSRVSESESRSQFHYVNPSRAVAAAAAAAATAPAEEKDVAEDREMKYRVLKALDQDVYYDFQHRKYRTTPTTPVPRCNNEEDRPRVHFYKVKVDGNS